MSEHATLVTLSDNALLARLEHLRHQEHDVTIEILRHLNEVERRKLHLKLGYSSLFGYCTERLEYSESAAGRRIQAARCMRRFRCVERLLRRNELSLSTVALIAPILDETNVDHIVSQARRASRRTIEALVANYRPPVELRDRVRPVRVVVQPALSDRDHSRGGSEQVIDKKEEDSSSQARPTAAIEGLLQNKPATEERLFIQFLASREFMAKYHEAGALLSNRIGKLSFEAVFTAVLDEFIFRHSPKERQLRREQRRARRRPRTTQSLASSGPGLTS